MSRKRICVYCGSSPRASEIFVNAATSVGEVLVHNQYDLVYGGASIGLMGAVADSVLARNGNVYGVMPSSLAALEIAHPGLTELFVTDSMHERKSKMADLSGGFIALPGGLGTLEELFEIWTWAQLSFHQKPIGLLNVEGYFNSLIQFLDSSTEAGFIKPEHRNMLIVHDTPDALLRAFNSYDPPRVGKLSV